MQIVSTMKSSEPTHAPEEVVEVEAEQQGGEAKRNYRFVSECGVERARAVSLAVQMIV
jgi:hypothetical protein